jgi:hypothetical protein
MKPMKLADVRKHTGRELTVEEAACAAATGLGREGGHGPGWPIVVGRVEIGAAHPGRGRLDRNLARSGRRDRHLLDLRRLTKGVPYRCFIVVAVGVPVNCYRFRLAPGGNGDLYPS